MTSFNELRRPVTIRGIPCPRDDVRAGDSKDEIRFVDERDVGRPVDDDAFDVTSFALRRTIGIAGASDRLRLLSVGHSDYVCRG